MNEPVEGWCLNCGTSVAGGAVLWSVSIKGESAVAQNGGSQNKLVSGARISSAVSLVCGKANQWRTRVASSFSVLTRPDKNHDHA